MFKTATIRGISGKHRCIMRCSGYTGDNHKAVLLHIARMWYGITGVVICSQKRYNFRMMLMKSFELKWKNFALDKYPRYRLFFSPLWLYFILAIILRAWLVIHTNGVIDGDESLVGIQAEHILRGEVPLYFYGQAYRSEEHTSE